MPIEYVCDVCRALVTVERDEDDFRSPRHCEVTLTDATGEKNKWSNYILCDDHFRMVKTVVENVIKEYK